MSSSEQITLGLAIIAAIVWLVRLEGRVNDAHRRCDDFKERLSGLGSLEVKVGKIESKIDNLAEDIKELNTNLKWLRPAEYDHLGRP